MQPKVNIWQGVTDIYGIKLGCFVWCILVVVQWSPLFKVQSDHSTKTNLVLLKLLMSEKYPKVQSDLSTNLGPTHVKLSIFNF